jgi:hypothetical protein
MVRSDADSLNDITDSRIFLACDIVALIVQAAGGAMASSAETSAGSDQGGKIMLGGIVFQLGQ